MKRRELLKNIGVLSVTGALSPISTSAKSSKKQAKKSFRVAHVTDIHIRPEHNALARFSDGMKAIKEQEVDFFLNTGDTIYAADYSHIKRERVIELWDSWAQAQTNFLGHEFYSCLGNHDMWWAAPSKEDEMYGKEYAVKQLEMPSKYYSFSKGKWHFIVLDTNNDGDSIDEKQREWLEHELEGLRSGTPVVFMGHAPIMSVAANIEGGTISDNEYMAKLFYKHKNKKIHCLSGHLHVHDSARYNGVNYYCNGAMSGFWWEKGDEKSAGESWYKETPPGYAILDLYEDGTLESNYVSLEQVINNVSSG